MKPSIKNSYLFTRRGSQRSLDDNFAMELIQKQLELDKNCTVELINQLVRLYSEAIEYLQYISDPRYLDFKARMHSMMMKPKVLETLNRQSFLTNHFQQNFQPRERKISRNVRRMMDSHNLRYSSLCDKVKTNFQLQQSGLEKMINRRKQKNRSLNNSFELEEIGQQYEEALMEPPRENFVQIDSVVEQNFLEMAGKIAEVTVKFQTQINKMTARGQKTESVKRKMEQEIKKVKEEYAAIRKSPSFGRR